MNALTYLKITMNSLSNILYNTSQSNSPHNSKDMILDSIKRMIQDYNDSVPTELKVDYFDHRTKKWSWTNAKYRGCSMSNLLRL